MPRFSTKDLLVATSIVVVGLSMGLYSCSKFGAKYQYDETAIRVLAPFVFYIIGWAVAGIGIMYPFKLVAPGALFGGIVGIVIMRFLL
jgi:hypothetical protein